MATRIQGGIAIEVDLGLDMAKASDAAYGLARDAGCDWVTVDECQLEDDGRIHHVGGGPDVVIRALHGDRSRGRRLATLRGAAAPERLGAAPPTRHV